MRTKALIITAALGLASAASSMAQAVYSVNVVGYINLTMRPGFNLVANQLKASPNNALNNVFPAVPADAQVLKFVNNDYTIDLFDGSGWVDYTTGLPSATTVSPGEGLFFYNPDPANANVTLVGEVTTGNNLTVGIPSGFSLLSSIVPQQIALSAANGFNAAGDFQYITFNAATQNYDVASLFDGTDWLNYETGLPVSVPTPSVGQGFFIFNPDVPVSWTRSFNPNN